MTKISYTNLISSKQRLSHELKIEYDKLVRDMKIFFRDSDLIPETLLSIPELEIDKSNENIQKIFNVIPTIDEDDMWEQLNSDRIFDKKHKPTELYKYGLKEFKNPQQKKSFEIFYSDGKNSDLYDSETPSFNPEESIFSTILTSHNIKAHSPEEKTDIFTSKILLTKFLSNNEIDFKSRFSEAEKTLRIQFPSLHPKVISYISLIKRALSIFLKSYDINFSSIDIFPGSNNRLLIFIASSEAKELNNFCSKNSFFTVNPYRAEGENTEASPLANSFTIFLDNVFEKSNFYKNGENRFLYFDLNLSTRDKSLRFNTIMNKRMERIIKTIQSLNNLHHKNNYEFDKSDFDNSYDNLERSIKDFKIIYEQWFKENSTPKSAEEEIELLEKKLAEKKRLFQKSNKK